MKPLFKYLVLINLSLVLLCLIFVIKNKAEIVNNKREIKNIYVEWVKYIKLKDRLHKPTLTEEEKDKADRVKAHLDSLIVLKAQTFK